MMKHGPSFLILHMLVLAWPTSAQENLLQPVWKATPTDTTNPEEYTGKYCNYSEFEGLEFTFSTDEVFRKYGFQRFSKSVDGLESLPFDEFSGKKGKIGRKAGGYSREVLVNDCSAVYLRNAEEIEAEDAIAFGVTFAAAPATDWVITHEVDRMTDAKSCYVTPKTSRMPYPMFFYHSKEGFSVGVIGGDFPGKSTTFRVNKNRAIAEVGGLSGARAQVLVSQIRAGGKSLLVGSYEWPHETEIVREFNLAGLAENLDKCKAAVAR
ncbi:hypothetical protein K7567_12550 [Stenotrophomonas maltophilia]|nr:hypothetical protein K7567_12550 [Stenotrophomonas maltophilia]